MRLKFSFNSAKALQALAFVANECPGLTPIYVAKIFFFAEKWHLNRFGRPIIADTYIAMRRGPVPSTIKDFIDQKWNWVGKPDGFDDVIRLDNSHSLTRLYPGERKPDFKLLSGSDRACLTEAIVFCKDKDDDELSDITHYEPAWIEADENRPMSYELFVDDDNKHKDKVLEVAAQFAARGVL